MFRVLKMSRKLKAIKISSIEDDLENIEIFDCTNPNGLTKEDYYNKVEELVCDKVAEFMKTTDKIIEVDLVKHKHTIKIESGFYADVIPESIAKLIYYDIIITQF